MSALRLATLVSHPIQYEVPVYRELESMDGVDSTVFFCSDNGLDVWDVPLLDGYEFEFLTSGLTVTDVRPPVKHVNPRVVDRLVGGDFDALVMNGWSSATSLLAVATAARIDLPTVLRGDSNPRSATDASGVTEWAKSAFLSTLFDHVDVFATIGTENERFYRRHGVSPERFVSAPLVVDNEWFREREAALPESRVLKRDLGVDPDAPVVLSLGRLVERKRPDDLLEAFVDATEPGEATLVYVGKGPQQEYLQRLASRNDRQEDVVFTGFVEQSALPRYYALADLFVLPSTDEPWGLVVNEAMNFGLPVVATDVVGAAVDLVDDDNGVVVPPEDRAALADAISTVLRDEEERRRMGAVSRERIERWSPERAATGLLEAARLADSNHGPGSRE